MDGSLSSPLLHQTLADIVTADARAADVFDRLGLDYCCHGHDTLKDAAAERRLAAGDILRDLAALGPKDAGTPDLAWGDLSDVTRHIVSTHHAYVRESTPRITAWLNKLVDRHGARHPELAEVRAVFAALAEEMRTHMAKEENILFPVIDQLAESARTGRRPPPGPFGTIMNPIRMMEADHREAGDGLARLRELTHAYQAPEDGCTTYRLCYEELARFEADLHRHVHLENNVLFPRAAALENELV